MQWKLWSLQQHTEKTSTTTNFWCNKKKEESFIWFWNPGKWAAKNSKFYLKLFNFANLFIQISVIFFITIFRFKFLHLFFFLYIFKQKNGTTNKNNNMQSISKICLLLGWQSLSTPNFNVHYFFCSFLSYKKYDKYTLKCIFLMPFSVAYFGFCFCYLFFILSQ